MSKHCCVSFADDLCFLASHVKGEVRVESAILADDLQSVVKASGLSAANAVAVLGNADYQLLKTKRPKVALPELKEALLWQEQSHLSIPADQIVVDYFDCHSAKDENTIYMVAVDKNSLAERYLTLQTAGLSAVKITIPELVYANYFGQRKVDSQATIWLNLYPDASQALLFNHGDLLTTMRLPMLESDSDYDALVKVLTLFYYEQSKVYEQEFAWVVNSYDSSLAKVLTEKLTGRVELSPQPKLDSQHADQVVIASSHARFGVLADA